MPNGSAVLAISFYYLNRLVFSNGFLLRIFTNQMLLKFFARKIMLFSDEFLLKLHYVNSNVHEDFQCELCTFSQCIKMERYRILITLMIVMMKQFEKNGNFKSLPPP